MKKTFMFLFILIIVLMVACGKSEEQKEAEEMAEKMEEAAKRKQLGNEDLMACSARYNSLMKSLREERNARS